MAATTAPTTQSWQTRIKRVESSLVDWDIKRRAAQRIIHQDAVSKQLYRTTHALFMLRRYLRNTYGLDELLEQHGVDHGHGNCPRCGGTGQYANFGACFRCGGTGNIS